ncbi:hypothetical protein LCGC14_1633810 [marine sediment metagenome]|uniref:Uncharacterized protein n=1 Tax=marine sediment metagenome TaxID=412755 RepID=A0A0F9KHG6_9ZZZZ
MNNKQATPLIGLVIVVILLIIATMMGLNQTNVNTPTALELDFYKNSTPVASEGGLNLIEGTGIDVTTVDDPANNRVDYTYVVGVPYRLPQSCLDAELAEWDTSTGMWLCVAAPSGGYDTIDDEDTPLTQRTTLNFAGAGVICADDTDQTTCTIVGGGSGYDTIEDEDTPLTQRTVLNFTGAGVICADDAGVQTTCTITGGGSGGAPPLAQLGLTSSWSIPGWYSNAFGTAAIIDGFVLYFPIYVAVDTTFVRIGTRVASGSGSGTARLGIYNWNNGLPGTLLLDAGTVDLSTTGNKEIVINQTLTQGYYFTAFVATVGTSTIQVYDINSMSPPVTGIAPNLGSTPVTLSLLVSGQAAQVAGGLADPASSPQNSALGEWAASVRLRN